tara:strand:+ start:416 stop:1273 length:858 start_codon:yes stop_codon:yes gene_type:complete
MSLLQIIAVVVIAALLTGGVIVFIRLRTVFAPIERSSLRHLIRRLRVHTDIYLPEGTGPFPTVILMHGCGGPRGVTEAYGRAAAAQGFIAFAPDSLALRRIDYREAVSKVCTGARLRAAERAGDLFAALEIVRADHRADSTRIALAGWSHGAWTILDGLTFAHEHSAPPSLTRLPDNPLKGVRGVFAFYPYSGFLARSRGHDWPTNFPVRALLVRGDTVCDDADSVRVFEARKAAGADANWTYIENATHGFDERDHLPGSGLVFDENQARMGEDRLMAFLKEVLG